MTSPITTLDPIATPGPWSVCSKTCGSGVQTRTNGAAQESRSCNTQACSPPRIIMQKIPIYVSPIEPMPKYSPKAPFLGYICFDPFDNVYMLKDNLSVITIRSASSWTYRTMDLRTIVKGLIPSWNGQWKTETVDDRIMFNAAGNACVILDLLPSNVRQVILLEINVNNAAANHYHVLSTENPQSNGWVYYYFRFEFKDANNDLYNGYPLIWYSVRGVHRVCRFVNSYSYQFTPVMPYGNNLLLTVAHLGRGNCSQTVQNKTFVCYGKMLGKYVDAFVTDHPGGTQLYAAYFDHITGSWSAETMVGVVDNKTDNHNGPVMTLDSKGYFHMVCAGHHKEFRYWKSGAPYNVSVWQPPKISEGKYTYAGIICDNTDRIYMAFRADGFNFHVIIKDGLDRWYTKVVLIRVTRGMNPATYPNYFYIRYNHILNLDSKNNVYMSLKPNSEGYYPIKVGNVIMTSTNLGANYSYWEG
ncbi:hypothetical protein HK102_012045 [Quaeritorhiza haematococci]|nr:hypothetical protein HK102_012045 [Quaeritorhiza haematococci]